MEFVFATNNPRKIKEIRQLAGDNMVIQTLRECGISEELPEPYETFAKNAWSKANYVFKKTGKDCWAEDSGLVVPALEGAPGVFSARYAGIPPNDERNNNKLLKEIEGKSNRTAYYHATICLILKGTEHYFEGRCDGKIIEEYRGVNGFGYDPLFIPDGFDKTFGELDAVTKNAISHRSKVFHKLMSFINAKQD
jgi:XTP/dITP diphosphohydrolase